MGFTRETIRETECSFLRETVNAPRRPAGSRWGRVHANFSEPGSMCTQLKIRSVWKMNPDSLTLDSVCTGPKTLCIFFLLLLPIVWTYPVPLSGKAWVQHVCLLWMGTVSFYSMTIAMKLIQKSRLHPHLRKRKCKFTQGEKNMEPQMAGRCK